MCVCVRASAHGFLVQASGLRGNIARSGERKARGKHWAVAMAAAVESGAGVGAGVGDAAEVEASPANPTDALLFRALATTSLYEPVGGDASDRRVATLGAANPEYAVYPSDAVATRTNDDANGAPEIVVQVRKRGGKVQLLIDGFVSEGVKKENVKNTWTHNLTWHRGLHEDVETGTRVFSPIAVVAAVEDGQHAFQNVTVAVVHQFEHYGAAILDPVTLSESELVGHGVADARCSVVRVPYPLACPNPPTVTILDDLKNARRTRLITLKTGATVLADLASKIWEIYNKTPLTGSISLIQLTGALQNAAAAGVTWSIGWTAWALFFASQIRLVGAADTQPQDIKTAYYNKTDSLGKVIGSVVTSAGSALSKAMNAPVNPGMRKTRFTLGELASVLESIATLRDAMDDDDLIKKIATGEDATTERYQKELLVWNWLLEDAATGSDLDTSKFAIFEAHASRLHIRISVDDALGCEAKPEYHEIHCKRKDVHLLAAAAAGTLNDLQRLYDAISKLESALDEAIGTPVEQTILNQFFDGIWTAKAYMASWLAELANSPENLTKTLDTFELLGSRRAAVQAMRAKWAAGSDPLKETRKSILKLAKERLHTKLMKVLYLPTSPGTSLKTNIERALYQKNLLVPPSQSWKRKLPQRASGTSRLLFSSSANVGTDHTDVEAGGVFVAAYSEYHRAREWLSESMRHGGVALRRFVREWEASSATRVRLECVCAAFRGATPQPLVLPVAHGTLVLTTPPDIQFYGAIAVPTEHAQRRIRLVVQRAQREPKTKSVLEALGLPHSSASLLACQVFGELWVEELVALWRLGEDAAHEHGSKQVEMLERASFRAATRLESVGTLLLELVVTKNPSVATGNVGDVPSTGEDVAFQATQAGRDAGLLMDRLLFGQDYLAVRTAMTPLIREAARVAIRAAQVFARTAPLALPHEPTASLFGHHLDGVAAFVRSRLVANGDVSVVEAAAAAYPSVRLLQQGEDEQTAYIAEAERRPKPQPPNPEHAMTPSDLVRTMRFRVASLRMDPMAAMDEAVDPATSVDALAKRLAVAQLNDPRVASFYVPFGFGDARPPPTLPPCAAPMFGSVPVFGDALTTAFDSIRRRPRDDANVPEADASTRTSRVLRVKLMPIFGCLAPPPNTPDSDEGESVHPNVVQVSVRATGMPIEVGYSASSVSERVAAEEEYSSTQSTSSSDTQEVPELTDSEDEGPPPLELIPGPEEGAIDATTNATAAANAHVRSQDATRRAADVSSVAWNAERVVQAVVAALASADATADYDVVELSLELPPDGRGGSPWYTKPHNPMALAQKKRKRQRWVDTNKHWMDHLMTHHKTMCETLLTDLVKNDVDGYFKNDEAVKANRGALERALDSAQGTTPWSQVVASRQRAIDALLDLNGPATGGLATSATSLAERLIETMAFREEQQAQKDAMDENPPPRSNDAETLRERIAEARKGLANALADIESTKQWLVEQLGSPDARDEAFDDLKRLLGMNVPPRAPSVATANARQYRALVGALGVGMGMLAPLVGGAVSLRCGSVTVARNAAIVGDWDVDPSLVEAFAQCAALRFSEACLVVASRV